MTRDFDGRLTSALGERLIVLLVIATITIASLAALPSLRAQTADTAAQMERRVHMYDAAQAELDSAP